MRHEVRYPGLPRPVSSSHSGVIRYHTGGSCPGEENSNSRMTNAEAKAAREMRADFDMTVRSLARMYSVSPAAMSLLLRGKTYIHAGGPLDPGRRPPGSGRANPRHRATLDA